MSSIPILHENSLNSSSTSRPFSSIKIITILAVVIFLAEIIAMVALYFVQTPNYLVTTVLDGLIMTVLILPGLYFLQLKPIWDQMEERAKAESALRSSEELLKKVLELLPVGVWIIDKDGNIVHGNPAGQEIWGGALYVDYPRYVEYKAWWSDSGKPVQPEEWAASRCIAHGEAVLDQEMNIETFDGRPKVILNSAVPMMDEQKNVQGVVVLNQDITQHRQMEKTLIRTNELLERFFLSIDTLIAYMDRDFNFIRVNETYARSSGHPPEFFTGKNHFEMYPHEENQAIFQRVVDTGEPFTVMEKAFEYAEYPERGVTYWDWSVQPVKGDSGAVEGLVLSLVDVTERKRAQIQLELKNQELLELSDAEHRQRVLAESLVLSTIAVNSSLKLEEVLDTILEQIHRAIPFRAADVALVEDRTVRVVGYLVPSSYPEASEAMKNTYLLDNYPVWQNAYMSQQPVFIEDTRTSPDWQIVPGMEWVLSFVTVPLIVGSRVIGLINLNSEQPGFFREEMSTWLVALAVPAALAIQNARIYMAESHARQVAETLAAAAQALTKTLDLEQVVNTLLDHIRKIVDSDTAGVILLEDEMHQAARTLRGYGAWADQENIPCVQIDGITDSVVRRMKLTRKSFVLSNPVPIEAKDEQPDCGSICNWLIVPIIAGEKFMGLVELGRTTSRNINPEIMQWAEVLAGQAAGAIQNAWLFQEVSSSSERLQSLARKLVEVQENERYWIARELHDEAGQALSLLKLNLGRLGQDADCPQHIRQKLEELKGSTDGVLEELHRMAMDLRPIALDHLGLVAALEQFAKNLNSDRLTVQFKALGFEGDRLPKDIETSLYRIVQEALANVIRHAQACNVGILLERDESRVKLFVEDDGVGFDSRMPENTHRLGLVGMRERAEMFGGNLSIESSPGKGTSIIVEVPYEHTHLYRG